MIHYLISVLSADTNVTTYVPRDKIFPLSRLQGTAVPCIVIQMVSTDPHQTKDSKITQDTYTVEITIMDEMPHLAWAASVAVRAVLDGHSDENIVECRFENMATDVFESTEVFSVTQRYLAAVNV